MKPDYVSASIIDDDDTEEVVSDKVVKKIKKPRQIQQPLH